MAVTKRTRKLKCGRTKTSYQATVYVSGVLVATKTFASKGAAYHWHEVEKEAYEKGLRSNGDPSQKNLEEVIRDYKSESFGRLRLTTQQAKENRLLNISGSPVGRVTISDFSGHHVVALIRWLSESPTATSPGRKSFTEELKMLSCVLNWYRDTYDAKYVIPIVKRHYQLAKFKDVIPRRSDYYLKPDECREWLEWMDRHLRDPVYYRLALVMTLTGLRLGEAAGLCWDAVDLSSPSSVKVKRSLTWDYRTKQPRFSDTVKTSNSHRTVNLPAYLVQVLAEMKQESQFIHSGLRPVFVNSQC